MSERILFKDKKTGEILEFKGQHAAVDAARTAANPRYERLKNSTTVEESPAAPPAPVAAPVTLSKKDKASE